MLPPAGGDAPGGRGKLLARGAPSFGRPGGQQGSGVREAAGDAVAARGSASGLGAARCAGGVCTAPPHAPGVWDPQGRPGHRVCARGGLHPVTSAPSGDLTSGARGLWAASLQRLATAGPRRAGPALTRGPGRHAVSASAAQKPPPSERRGRGPVRLTRAGTGRERLPRRPARRICTRERKACGPRGAGAISAAARSDSYFLCHVFVFAFQSGLPYL